MSLPAEHSHLSREERNLAIAEQSQRQAEAQDRLRPVSSVSTISDIIKEQKEYQRQVAQIEEDKAEQLQKQLAQANADDAAFRNHIFTVESVLNEIRANLHGGCKFANANRLNDLRAIISTWNEDGQNG